ncbi:MerC domain-containing protein [Agarivorans sp. JK6]|uniref:MerC domain-containing protein n=1 Tax=Agarivorans sp. JK6 TaxID=2997426 RepID=UPI0038737A69
MKVTQAIGDKFAIGLSFACAIHCLVLPLLFVLVPSMVALPLHNEAFHLWMVVAVIPISAYALTMGCKQHKRTKVLLWGIAGLALLILAVALGEDRIGEIGEKSLTLLGATLVAVGHWMNYRLCHQHDHNNCDCPEH